MYLLGYRNPKIRFNSQIKFKIPLKNVTLKVTVIWVTAKKFNRAIGLSLRGHVKFEEVSSFGYSLFNIYY